MDAARKRRFDVLTRLRPDDRIDETLMEECRRSKIALEPQNLVGGGCDDGADVGANVAREFNERLGLRRNCADPY